MTTNTQASSDVQYIEQYIANNQQKSQEQAKTNLAQTSQTAYTSKVGKDTVVPAGGDLTSPHEEDSDSKGELGRHLPPPKNNWDGVQDGDQQSLIAIMGQALAIQARTQSQFWSTMWKQASESMMTAVKFAPAIADAVKMAANENASATRANAHKELYTAISCTVSFAATVGMGAFMEWQDPEATGANDDSVTANDEKPEDVDINGNKISEDQSNDTGLNTADGGNNNASEATGQNQAQESTTKKLAGDDKSNGDRLSSKGKALKTGGAKGMTRFSGWMTKAVGAAQLTGMMSQASASFIGWRYDMFAAAHQGQQGVYDAQSKELESFQQFFSQSFSRADSIRQTAGQAVDYAMSILKGAADTITQAVMGMFRG